MESRNFLRFLFIFLSVSLVLFFTWVHLPYAPQPNSTTDLLDCSTNSPWCTSKNRFQPINKPSTADNILEKPPNPKHHNHESDTPYHPLDPLTISEINKVRTILKSHTLFKSSSPCAFHSIVLEEPDKTLVLKWKKGDSMLPRKAAVVARVAGKSYVLTVDISTGEVAVQENGSRSGYPTMTIEDMTSSTWAPLSNADFNRTIIERGVELQDLACLPISLGWFGENEENRRLIKVQCYSMKGTANFYMRPIEGLTVLLDMDSKEVVEISDKGRDIPIPKAANTDYRYSLQEINPEMMFVNPISTKRGEFCCRR